MVVIILKRGSQNAARRVPPIERSRRLNRIREESQQMDRQSTLIVTALVTCGMLSALSGCKTVPGSGTLVTESREVHEFDCVSLAGSGRLFITQNDQESLTIEAEDNIIPHITAEVKGRKLLLGLNRDSSFTAIRPTKPIIFTPTMKEIAGLELTGSGSIEAPSVETNRLDVNIAGSGEIAVGSLTAEEVRTEITGSGRCDIAGEAARESIEISGSGTYRAPDLESEATAVEISGSGSATVWTEEKLAVAITGTGNVDYYGDPTLVRSVTGSGKVRSLGARGE
jgi:hypothetical protein